MGEFLKYSELAFLESFCESGNAAIGVIFGIGIVVFGVHRIVELYKRK